MAAELALLSSTQYQKKTLFRQMQSEPMMWNPNQIPQVVVDDDDSWEVRAFEKDSSNITWPPRSYTCTFCRREFRSAQALGGHMNVHRRDRARLHHVPPPPPGTNIPTSNTTTYLFPSQEIVATNGGLCFVYSLPNPNGGVSSTPIGMNTLITNSPTNFASISTFGTNNLYPSSSPPSYNTSISPSWKFTLPSESKSPEIKKNSAAIEELDLELRLGRR